MASTISDDVRPAMRILLAYDSLSGNTQEAARLVGESFACRGHQVEFLHVSLRQDQPLALFYDLVVLGSWTGGLGRTPSGMKAFVARLEPRPAELAVFGTGETQWGLSYFCGAVDRLASYFGSDYPRLKLEQMPSTERARRAVDEWVGALISHRETRNHSHAT